MKYIPASVYDIDEGSPSMRREWIEILMHTDSDDAGNGLPPCGGSGLKSLDGLAESINESLPPCGGSGLK